jgi:peptidoglycan/xylan/chitin deacetylase (PgdA/CDA1 family)
VALAAGCSKAPTPELVGSSSAALAANGGQYQGDELPKGTIALTFDDGPGDFGAGIADYLKTQGIQAGFFDNGDRFKTSTDLYNENGIDVTAGAYSIVQKCLDDGHIVGNHTVTHRDMVDEILDNTGSNPSPATQLFDELNETDIDLTTNNGVNYIPSGFYLFRSPYGSYSSGVWSDLKGTSMNKYVGDINWAFGGVSTNWPGQAADWACWQGDLTTSGGQKSNPGTSYAGYATTQQCGDAYLAEITGADTGGIVLMHDPYSWAQGNTLDMVKYIVPKLQAKGFKFVRVDDVPSIKAALPKCDASCATCNGVGSNYCTSCATGKYLDGTSCNACTVCGTGQYQETACGKTSDTVCAACSTCAAGSVPSAACSAKADTVCSQCAPGSYAGAGATSCTPCAAGTIAPGAGASSCTACPAGTDTSGTGQTACSACAAGTSSDAGAGSCSSCAAGSYAPSMSAACTECPAGTYSAAGAASCTACADGTYSDAGATSCTTCGSCDDGDSCTTDSCGATTGCSHAAISGCTPSGDAGTTDASTPGGGSGSDGGTTPTGGADSGSGGGGGSTTTADGGTGSGAGGTGVASGGDGGSGDSSSSGDDSSGGCNQSGGGSGSPVLVGFALGALLLRRRRRAA